MFIFNICGMVFEKKIEFSDKMQEERAAQSTGSSRQKSRV
jgi:hypothetical protein